MLRREAVRLAARRSITPGERCGRRWLLDRAWELRDSVRGWDAFYVALAEAFDATLLTLDAAARPGARPAL